VFSGLSTLFADVVMIIAPLLILAADGAAVVRWFIGRRPATFCAMAPLPANGPGLDVVGLLDPVPTDRIPGRILREFRNRKDNP
jgi:hypothetical protein